MHDYINDGLPPSKTEKCSLYIIRKSAATNEIFYKIGISNNPKARVRSLDNHPLPLDLISYYEYKHRDEAVKAEKISHDVLAEKRVRLEWFTISTTELITLDRMIRVFTNCTFQHLQPWHFNS